MRVAFELLDSLKPEDLHLQVRDEQLAVDAVVERQAERVEAVQLLQETVHPELQGGDARRRIVAEPAVELVEPALGPAHRAKIPEFPVRLPAERIKFGMGRRPGRARRKRGSGEQGGEESD